MVVRIPGWLPLAEAAKQYGMSYQTLRTLAISGVLTRGSFISDKPHSAIFLRTLELDAYKRGGPGAVLPVKEEFEKAQNKPTKGK